MEDSTGHRSSTPSPVTTGASTGRAEISLLTAVCLVIADMVGMGIYTSLGFQVGELPSGFAIVVLWLVGGLCALCGALCYGELAAALPRSGGEYHFLGAIYHPAVGFLAGWISATVGFAAPVALAAMAFGRYLHAVTPAADPLVLSLLAVWVTTLVLLRGVQLGSLFQNAATLLKVTLLLVLITAGAFVVSEQAVSFLPTPGDARLILSAPFAVSLVFVMYAYSGWNAATYVIGEVRNAARNVPRALALGTLVVTAIYVAVNAVFFRVTPIPEMAGKLEVALIAGAHIFGSAGVKIMAGLIALGLISTITAMMWIGPRVTMTMGEDVRLLRFLARRTEGGIPLAAMLLQLGIVHLLLLTATFETVLTYIQFSLTFCSFLTVLGVIVLRQTHPELPRPYKTWGYPVTPLLFLAISLWMLAHIFISAPRESLAGLGTMAVGLVIYFLSPKAPRVPPAEASGLER